MQIPADVTAYIDALDDQRRPLFDRVQRLILEVQPDVEVVIAYKLPTFVVGQQQLHVGVWKHGVSFYGWQYGRDGGLPARYPQFDTGKGTFKLPLAEAAQVTDDELRAFLTASLSAP